MSAIPRALERYPLGDAIEGGIERWNATDRERGRDVVVTRVRFGAEEREARDALIERVRALFAVTSPALIAALDAGEWQDDAFVVEERVIEARPLDAVELDARERTQAARSIAEGIAALHEAGWSLASLDVVVDAYRQARIAIATAVLRATPDSRASDLQRLSSLVSMLAPGTPAAASAAEIASAIAIAEPGPSTPLVHASTPTRSPLVWIVLIVLGAVLFAIVQHYR